MWQNEFNMIRSLFHCENALPLKRTRVTRYALLIEPKTAHYLNADIDSSGLPVTQYSSRQTLNRLHVLSTTGGAVKVTDQSLSAAVAIGQQYD